MSERRRGARAVRRRVLQSAFVLASVLALVLALLPGSGATAQATPLSSVSDPGASQDRFAEIYGQRVRLQNDMREWLEHALVRVARPYEMFVTVRVTMKGQVQELVTRDTQPGLEMHLGAQGTLNLPGLPDTELAPDAPGVPQVIFRVPAHERVEVQKQLRGMVEQIGVRIFVDEQMPASLRDALKSVAVDLVGLDGTRGDSVTLETIAATRVPEAVGDDRASTTTIWQAARASETWLLPASLIMSAMMLSLALWRRGSRSGAGGGGGGGAAAGDRSLEMVGAPVTRLTATAMGPAAGFAGADTTQVASDETAEKNVVWVDGGARPFAFFGDATPQDVEEALGRLDAPLLAFSLGVGQLPAAIVGRVLRRLSDDSRAALVSELARADVVPLARIREAEQRVRLVLQAVQSHIRLGGVGRVADMLSVIPTEMLHATLDGLYACDAGLAAQVRKRLVLFEDFASLSLAQRRHVVTALEPAALAMAMVGAADALRTAIREAMSKRAAGILDAEEETMGEHTSEQVQEARRTVEGVMRTVVVRALAGPGPGPDAADPGPGADAADPAVVPMMEVAS